MKHIQGNVLKRRGKKNQSGRSMVEMLGVLAIIGVLSVGGIAGYRMAMLKIFENDVRGLVARIYQAVQSSMINPNTYLNCCSGNRAGGTFNNCDTQGTWYQEQYDEICSYLSPDDCAFEVPYNDLDLIQTDKGIVWFYQALRQESHHYSVMSMHFARFVNQYGNDSLSHVCENVLTDIVSNPVYREKLVGIGPYRVTDYAIHEITPENIKRSCRIVGSGYSSFSLYFENDNLVDCIEEK